MSKVPRPSNQHHSLASARMTALLLRFLLITFAFGLAAEICPGLLVSTAPGQGVGAKKMVLIQWYQQRYPPSPLDLFNLTLTENGEPVAPEEPQIAGRTQERFLVGDDWLRNLSFVLKNSTSLNIAWLRVVFWFAPGDLQFPFNQGAWPWRPDQIPWFLRLGKVPEAAAKTYTPQEESLLESNGIGPFQFAAGQELTISLADYAKEIHATLEPRIPLSTITKCFIVIDTVYFENSGEVQDVRWSGEAPPGEYEILDPGGPHGFRRLDPTHVPSDRSIYKALGIALDETAIQATARDDAVSAGKKSE